MYMLIHLRVIYCMKIHTHTHVYDTFLIAGNIFIPQNLEEFRGEIRSLQSKLSEVSGSSIQQGERLREVRKAKREVDQENADLKAKLKNAQVHSVSYNVYCAHIVLVHVVACIHL